MGPFDQTIAWSSQGVKGASRFLERFWNLALECGKNKESSLKARKAIHKLNKKIDEDLERAKFNTPIAAFMEFVNFASLNKKDFGRDVIERALVLLAPFASHITEELWQQLSFEDSVHKQKWPKHDPELVKEEIITLIVQINGKVRDKIEVEVGISEERAKELALSREKIKKWIGDKEIKKIIFVPRKLINIVI